MLSDSQRMINKVYEGLIVTCLSMSDHPMRCKEIAETISDRSDFPKVTPQFVSRRMDRLLAYGEVSREERRFFREGRRCTEVVFSISSDERVF
jgi:DNA-binding HxlR family transcriptional regulator